MVYEDAHAILWNKKISGLKYILYISQKTGRLSTKMLIVIIFV
jgi:hypothetical protein